MIEKSNIQDLYKRKNSNVEERDILHKSFEKNFLRHSELIL